MTTSRLYWDCTDGQPFPAVYDEVAHNVLLANFSVGQSRHFEARRLQHSRDVGLDVLKKAWQSDHVFPVHHIGNCFRIIRERLGPIATSALGRKGMREMFAGKTIGVSTSAHHLFDSQLQAFAYQSVNHETGHRADTRQIEDNVELRIVDASESIGRESIEIDTLSIARASAWAGPAGACFIIDPNNTLGLEARDFPPLQLDPLLFSFAVVSWEVNVDFMNERFETNQHLLETLMQGLSTFPEISLHTPRDNALRASHLLSFSIEDCDAEFAAMLYDEEGISVGSQSACLAQSGQPSEVLQALGIETAGHLRVSLPLVTTSLDVERFLETTQRVIAHITRERAFLAE